MQTDPNVLRYMVSKRGSSMAVNSQTMQIFDHLSDARAHATSIGAWHIWVLSPTAKPRKIGLGE